MLATTSSGETFGGAAGATDGLANPASTVVGGDADVREQDLIDYCRKKIAHYKCPTSVEFRQELARTATGKLQKFKLRAPYWEGVEKGIN